MLLSFPFLSYFLQLLIKYIEIAEISYKIILTNFFCKIQKKIYFFIIFTKNVTTQKILKMENKHPEHFWSA